MAEQNTILQTIKPMLLSIKPLLQGATEAVEDGMPAVLLNFMDEVGLEIVLGGDTLARIQTILGDLSAIYNTIATVIEKEEPPGLDKTLQMVTAITEVVDAFDSFSGLNLQFATPEGVPATMADFGRSFLEYLIADYLKNELFRIYNILVLIGLIRPGNREASSPADRISRLDLAILGLWLSDPKQALVQLYRWGQPDFELFHLLVPLAYLLNTFGVSALFYLPGQEEADVFGTEIDGEAADTMLRIPLWVDPNDRQNLSTALGVALVPARDASASMIGFAAVPYGAGGASKILDIDTRWQLDYRFSTNVTSNYGLLIGFQGISFKALDNSNLSSIELAASAAILRKMAAEGKTFIFGQSDTGGLEAAKFGLRLGVKHTREKPEIFVEFLVEEGNIAIRPGQADGFLKKILPADGLDIPFSLTLGLSNKLGLYFEGSAGLEVTLPLHLDLFGIFKIDSVFLSIQAKDTRNTSGIELIVAASIDLALGPIKAHVEQMGLSALLTFPSNGGNLGVANLVFGFKEPKGAGLAIDAGAVVGGGYLYFDTDKQQYAGVLQLEVKGGIAIKAIGLITTKMPDGSPGFSMLIIVTVEFTPIQIGFGFSLNGVGGLAGFNRTMRLDALRDGIKNRTLDSILFPPDPVANAQKIVSDLQTVFPPAPGRFVVAPMVRLGWGGSILIMDIGLAVELPSPLRLALMGKLHLLLPPITDGDEDEPSLALIELHMDVLGTLDLDKNEFTLDAVLYDSRIAFFTISGGMALRLRWGSDPVFALAIGGFNPRYTPPPGFPLVERLTLQLTYNEDGFRAGLRLTSYLAVTSNTLQFGARIDVFAEKVGLATITGYLGFDALIEFNPPKFIVDLYGGVSVEAFGFHFSVDLYLSLSGTKPWIGDGHATVEFLGTHRIPVHFKSGPDAETPSLPLVDPLNLLKTELEDPRNWSAALPASGSMFVTLRQLSADETKGLVLVHPLGELSVRERVVPLGIALERFGTSFPTTPGPFELSSFSIENVTVTPLPEAISDAFARGQFVNLSEDQKLSTPAFERFRCGAARIGTDKITSGAKQSAIFEYDVTIIDNKEELKKRTSRQLGSGIDIVPLSDDYLWRGAQFGAASQTPMRSTGSTKFAGNAQGIKVSSPTYTITDMDTLSTQATATFATYTEAEAMRRRDAQGDLQVIEAYELKL